jgi:hypothetical protein
VVLFPLRTLPCRWIRTLLPSLSLPTNDEETTRAFPSTPSSPSPLFPPDRLS